MKTDSSEKRIFTFWEPRERVPGYIRLCMKTWEKFLPEYTTELCDYKTLSKYLTAEELTAANYPTISLAKQSDTFRCSLLYRYGGLWIDADTIFTPAFDANYFFKGDCCAIGNKQSGFLNGAFFYTVASGSEFVSEWHDELMRRLAEYRKFMKWKPFFQIFNRSRWRIVRRWDFFLNGIIDSLVKQYNEPELVFLERKEIRALPELIFSPDSSMDDKSSYLRFWFTEEDTQEKWVELKKNKGIIMLHNSWTPDKYRQMSEEEFLSSNCFLATYLKSLLNL